MTGNMRVAKAGFILFVLFAWLLAAEQNVQAQTPQFRLDIDNLRLQQGVSTTLVLSMVDAKGAELKEIKGLESFDILSTGNSTSTLIANGEETYRYEIQYIVMPKEQGAFTLQGVVELNGTTYTTNELKVDVREAVPANEATEDVFIRTNLSDAEFFFGQKVVLTYELYTRVNISNFGFPDNVAIDGVILQDVPEDQLTSEIVYLNGVKYARYEAKKSILTPVRSGTFTVPAYTFQVNVGSGGFFNVSKPVYLQTESRELTVKPLPATGRPDDFSGVVGVLTLESSYSGQTVSFGDAVTLAVTASGNVNLDGLRNIIPGNVPGFTVYQTEIAKDERVENNEYTMTKQFEIILVPKQIGQLTVDSIRVPYFNPETGAYAHAEIPGATIAVDGELPQTVPSAAAPNETAATETIVIDQVSYEPSVDGYVTFRLKQEHLFGGSAVLAGCAAVAVFAVRLYSRRRSADRSLRSYYLQIKRSNDPHDIYDVFNRMMKESCGISVKANTRQDIADKLADREWAGLVIEIMDVMELGTFRSDSHGRLLKTKIGSIYKALKKQRRESGADQAVRFRT